MMIPRATEVSKITSEEAQKNLANIQQQTAAAQLKAEDSLRQVYSKAGSQDVRIAEKQKESRENEEKKKKGGSGKQAARGNPRGQGHTCSGSTIDIKI